MKSVPLSAWLLRANEEQRIQLYKAAKTTGPALYQVATGRRQMSAKKAALVESATVEINRQFPELPPVLRTSSCKACSECPFAKKCGGAE